MALIGLFTEGALAAGHELSDCYRELGAQIVLADELGYDFFSTTQSYGFDHPGSSFSAVVNPLALFAARAPLTRHISILTGIVIAPFHHPAIALSDFATVDVLSHGRVMIGIGRGHPWIYERLGFDQDESRERISEFCRMTRTILDAPDQRHTLLGRFWQIKDFELLPKFVQERPGVYCAVSRSPSSAIEAATHGFGIISPAYLGTPIDVVEALGQTYRDEYQRLWGSRGKVLLGINFFGLDDEKTALATGAKGLAGQLKLFGQITREQAGRFGQQYAAYRQAGEMFDELSDPKRCQEVVLSEWPRRLALWGNKTVLETKLKYVIERLRPDGLILNIECGGIPFDMTVSSMRFFAEHLMPQARQWLDGK